MAEHIRPFHSNEYYINSVQKTKIDGENVLRNSIRSREKKRNRRRRKRWIQITYWVEWQYSFILGTYVEKGIFEKFPFKIRLASSLIPFTYKVQCTHSSGDRTFFADAWMPGTNGSVSLSHSFTVRTSRCRRRIKLTQFIILTMEIMFLLIYKILLYLLRSV